MLGGLCMLVNQKIPKHVAIIMDGNGRWAKKQNLPRSAGHKKGAENIRRISIECNTLGIQYLTCYAFSTENWKRPASEIDYLCKLPKIFFDRYLKELMDNDIRVTFIGEIEKFPKTTQDVIHRAVEKTQHNTGLQLCLALNYGARREIILAAMKYSDDVIQKKRSKIIDEEQFSKYLMHFDIDLLIRTSGECRLSNFMLWQVAYAEIVISDALWPDFSGNELKKCFEIYASRTRKFGGLKDED